ncbi:MAG TPA: EAL domain-containing protein [Acidimicrobiia bacterium]|nr:EAL domain-containing protein [Acidimicrobiia bacterium]
MEAERRRSLRPIWALTVVVTAGAVALLPPVARAGVSVPGAARLPWWVLAGGFVLAETFPLHLRFRGEAHSFSLNEIVLVLGLFATTPLRLLAAQLAGSAVALVFVRRQGALKIAFNLAQWAIGTEIAIVVFHAIAVPSGTLSTRNWLAALVAAAAASVVQYVAIAIAITLAEGHFSGRENLKSLVWGLLSTVVNTMLGLVVVIVCSESIAATVLLVGPIAVVLVAYRAYVSEHSKSEGLQFLYRASELLGGARDLEAGLLALLDFARETFHAEIAEVVLRGDSGESIGYRTCSGPGERRFRLEPCAVDEVAAVLALAGEAREVTIHRPDGRSEFARRDGVDLAELMVAPFSDESGVCGVALAARAKGSVVDTFSKDELHLFETFVNHLGTTLEKSRLSTSLAQLRVLKQELAHQAYHDSLTGLANRLKFRDLVDNALAAAARDGAKTAVLFIDLDDFKTVNDTMGHAAGDALLEEVARRISTSVEGVGTAARLGGDEFAVLLPRVANDSVVRAAADRILVALGDPVLIDGQPVVAQASIGIAAQTGAANADELMQHADVAMYTAKRNGKGRFDEFEPNMSLTVARRHQLKMGLERALANNEFALQYQPVIDVASATVTGVEALIRWKDPARGLMPPSEFVGVAEETGLIVPIGRFVLREACRQAAAWDRVFEGVRIFVNLSTRQLADDDLVDDVRAALVAAGLEPRRLVLEVTETAMMRDIDEATATLYALKDLGVSIAIDDFGTGFSSLSYLRQLPIDVLKIAKPIIDALCESPQDAAFVKGIIELGHVVGLTVVAEGVEQVEQYAQLFDMGCDFVQGYYYAPALDPTDIGAMLAGAADGAALPASARPATLVL